MDELRRGSSPLTKTEAQVIERWVFWVRLSALIDERDSEWLISRVIEWAFACDREGLHKAPPWLILIFGLSLEQHPQDSQRLHRLLNAQALTDSARHCFQEIYHRWLTQVQKRDDWRLARRRLLILSHRTQAPMIGLCLAQILNPLKTLELDSCEQIDLTSLKLWSDHHPRLIQQATRTELALQESQRVERLCTQLSHHVYPMNTLIMTRSFIDLIQHFEALSSPARRILYQRIHSLTQHFRLNISHHLHEPHNSSFMLPDEASRVALVGELKGLGRSGKLEQVSYTEWSYLGEEVASGFDYFMLKYAERDLLYHQRDIMELSKSRWEIEWYFSDLTQLIERSEGLLSYLSWAHLISWMVTAQLKHDYGEERLSEAWIWSERPLLEMTKRSLEEEQAVFSIIREESERRETLSTARAFTDHISTHKLYIRWRGAGIHTPSTDPSALSLQQKGQSLVITLNERGGWSIDLPRDLLERGLRSSELSAQHGQPSPSHQLNDPKLTTAIPQFPSEMATLKEELSRAVILCLCR